MAHDELRAHWPRYVIIGVLLIFLFVVRRILVSFVIGAILAYIFVPLVEGMRGRIPLPRLAIVVLFFTLTLIPFAVAFIFLAPTFIEETEALLAGAPDMITYIVTQLIGGDQIVLFGQVVAAQDISDQIIGAMLDFLGQPSEAIHVASGALQIGLNVVLSLVMTFYFTADSERFGRGVLLLLPPHMRPPVQETAARIHVVLGHYIRGLFYLILLMAAVTWLGLTLIFHLPYALPIAIATGLLETVPLLGPILAGAIAALVGLEHGGVSQALGIIIFYYVVRQAEDQFVAPYVLGRVVQLHPVVSIFAVLAGNALAGVLGMILAIPIAAAIRVTMDYWELLD